VVEIKNEEMKFKDAFAAGVVAAILIFWGLQGVSALQSVPGEVNGALISAFTLIVQYYFRKRGPSEGGQR